MAIINAITDTWNNPGTVFTAIKMTVTNTASASGSKLIDLLVGASSKFSVDKDGAVAMAGPLQTNGVILGASNALEQRNGTNAQSWALYNTYTDGSNYEAGVVRWASNALEIATTNAGTGANRNIYLRKPQNTAGSWEYGATWLRYVVAAGPSYGLRLLGDDGAGHSMVDLGSGGAVRWGSNQYTQLGSLDTSLYRGAAGRIDVCTTGPGVYGDLKLANLTATGVIALPSGTEAAPSIWFGQSNTGIYSNNAARVTVSAGGSARLECSSQQVLVEAAAKLGWVSAGSAAGGTFQVGFIKDSNTQVGVYSAGPVYADLKVRTYLADATITAGGTTGAQTINKSLGAVNFAAGATSLVVTNSIVTTSSIIFCTIRTNDSTAAIKNVVPTAGSFTINLNAAATAETSVGFIVHNG